MEVVTNDLRRAGGLPLLYQDIVRAGHVTPGATHALGTRYYGSFGR